MSQPSPLTPARQRAQALADSGDRAGAVALLEHAVGLGRSNLGEDDPDVVAAAHQLARIHQEMDDPSAARRVLEEAYAAGHWRLGDADPLMLEISYDLGVVAEELGNRHEARKAFARVVEAGQPVLGDFHWAVVKAKAYLDGDTDAPRPPPISVGNDQPSTVYEAPPPLPRVPQNDPRPPLPRRTPADQTEPPPVQPPPVQPMPVQPMPVRPTPPLWEVPPPVERLPAVQQRPNPGDEPTIIVPRIVLPEYQPPLPLVHRMPLLSEAPAQSSVPPASKRGPAIFAAIAAVLAAVIAVAALVFVLADRGGGDGSGQPDVPTLGGGPPPADVRVRDFGTSVEVTWSDPGEGKTSFVIAGGHPGEVLKAMGEVGPGETRYKLQGLNDQLDYCFAVLAVYSATEFASSPQTCTSRPGPTGTG